MTHEVAVRVGMLYGPMVMAVAGWILAPARNRNRTGAAVLVAVLWLLPVLWALQTVNQRAGWWKFTVHGPAVRGMPLEAYLGWVVLWGAVPVLLPGRLPWAWRVVTLVSFDLLVMPMCSPVLVLSREWLWGEAGFVVVGLLPAVLLGEWTRVQRFPARRAWMQVVMAGMVVLFLLPECVFVLRGGGWEQRLCWLRTHPRWENALGAVAVQCVLLLGGMGVAAAREFGVRGAGTPIPFDPPRRLVVSGVYRYVANPMQLSCVLVMLAWAAVLRSGWLALGAVVSVVYSVGLAAWDEGEDLRLRFGERWVRYRGQVRGWRVRWRPYVEPDAAPAVLWVSAACGPCSEVRLWFERHEVRGMVIRAAEEHPTQRLRRVRYEDGEYGADGVRAVFRALEHVHFGWAFAGIVLGMPGVWWVVQVVMDGCGLGEREIGCRTVIKT